MEPSGASAGPVSWIHEFRHPAVVTQLHFPAHVPHSRARLEQALSEGAYGVELDLLATPGGGVHDPDAGESAEVRCAHDRVTAASPRLAEMIEVVLAHRGARRSVHGDGLAFFLVLEPKRDDPALYEGIYRGLSAVRDVLSTAARPGTGPRPITVVVTGRHARRCRDWLHGRHGTDTDRLMIAEGVDYAGRVEDLSGAPHPSTFQWTAIRLREGLRGHVNPLHLGREPGLTGRFNVRVWDTDSDSELRRALAAGFDSVNCDPGRVTPFRTMLAAQRPLGREPSLTIRDGRAALVWRGVCGDDLYLAVGSLTADGLSLPRQLCLSTFLPGRLRVRSAAVALLPDGRVLIVHRSGRHSLGYLAGRLARGDRYPTFEGVAAPITLGGGGGGGGGGRTRVAVAPDGLIAVLCAAASSVGPRLLLGRMDPAGRLDVREHALTLRSRRGYAPAIGFAADGSLLVVHLDPGGRRLATVVGRPDADGGFLPADRPLQVMSGPVTSWGNGGSGPGSGGRRPGAPSVALTPQGRVLIAHAGAGRREAPAIAVDVGGDVVLLRRTARAGDLAYLHGRWDERGGLAGTWRPVELRLPDC